MMGPDWLMQVSGGLVVLSPLLLATVLGITSLFDWKISEKLTTRWIAIAIAIGLLSLVVVLGLMLWTGTRNLPISLGNWVSIPSLDGHESLYHFSFKLVFDRLSVPFAFMSLVLSGTIGLFASKYMHRESGFNRFFVLYAFFVVGMVVTSLAGTIETLFTGWELVGLSSALLVAFFQERRAPAKNGLWIWVIYRVSDASLFLAAVAMHHLSGEGDFDELLGSGTWPEESMVVTPGQALVVGLLLLGSAMGKSALVPFSGWLPRAMEGPTPSSAVFYGALSVHLGAFLLLRVSPLLDESSLLSLIVFAVGVVTAVYAYLAGSVQTDIKSALSFASLSQVGIIVAEIGVGCGRPWLRYLALVHIIGHASMRTLQFVRAPSLLQDYRSLENAIGNRLPSTKAPWERLGAERRRDWLYRFALERGYLDSILLNYLVNPFVRTLRWCDALERRWTDYLTGEASRESDLVKRHHETIEDLL